MCEFRFEPPTITIADGNVLMDFGNGDRHCTPLRVFRVIHETAAIALAEHDRGNVVPFPGKPKPRRFSRKNRGEVG
jgi:hypothetical protein